MIVVVVVVANGEDGVRWKRRGIGGRRGRRLQRMRWRLVLFPSHTKQHIIHCLSTFVPRDLGHFLPSAWFIRVKS